MVLEAEKLGMTSTEFVFVVPGSSAGKLMVWESDDPDADNEMGKRAFKQVLVVSAQSFELLYPC